MNTLDVIRTFMNNEQRKYEVSANNLANSTSNGFKRHLYIERNLTPGTLVDTSAGPLTQTGNNQHVALEGNTYFTVSTKNGNLYTRNGDFSVNEKLEVVTSRGDKVMGKNGPITLQSRNLHFDNDGNVYDNDVKVDSLMLMEPTANSRVTSIGQGLLDFQAQPAQGNGLVRTESLEGSNVSVMDEMVGMMTQFRNFQFGQRLVKMQDTLMAKYTTEVGKSSA